jgi:hypothetical protein
MNTAGDDRLRTSVKAYQLSMIDLAEHVVDETFGVGPWSWSSHYYPLEILLEMTKRAERNGRKGSKGRTWDAGSKGSDDLVPKEVVDLWYARFAGQIDQLGTSTRESLKLAIRAKQAGETLRDALKSRYHDRSENWAVVELIDGEAEEARRGDGDDHCLHTPPVDDVDLGKQSVGTGFRSVLTWRTDSP